MHTASRHTAQLSTGPPSWPESAPRGLLVLLEFGDASSIPLVSPLMTRSIKAAGSSRSSVAGSRSGCCQTASRVHADGPGEAFHSARPPADGGRSSSPTNEGLFGGRHWLGVGAASRRALLTPLPSAAVATVRTQPSIRAVFRVVPMPASGPARFGLEYSSAAVPLWRGIGQRRRIDIAGQLLDSGLFDLHAHGGVGSTVPQQLISQPGTWLNRR